MVLRALPDAPADLDDIIASKGLKKINPDLDDLRFYNSGVNNLLEYFVRDSRGKDQPAFLPGWTAWTSLPKRLAETIKTTTFRRKIEPPVLVYSEFCRWLNSGEFGVRVDMHAHLYLLAEDLGSWTFQMAVLDRLKSAEPDTYDSREHYLPAIEIFLFEQYNYPAIRHTMRKWLIDLCRNPALARYLQAHRDFKDKMQTMGFREKLVDVMFEAAYAPGPLGRGLLAVRGGRRGNPSRAMRSLGPAEGSRQVHEGPGEEAR